jgi:hypothetical protein
MASRNDDFGRHSEPALPPSWRSAWNPWGAPQPPGSGVPTTRFCPACGTALVNTAAICPKCGTAVGSPRTKGVAVLLAVLFSCWAWLYTYQQDKDK